MLCTCRSPNRICSLSVAFVRSVCINSAGRADGVTVPAESTFALSKSAPWSARAPVDLCGPALATDGGEEEAQG